MTDLSVVIPVYDRPDDLLRAVTSVLRQGIKALEVIVVDDGSPSAIDPSAFSSELPTNTTMRVIRHGTRRGAGAARNAGVQAASGTIVAFLDSDDEWLPGMAETIVSTLSSGAVPAAMVTAFVLVRPSGRAEVRSRSLRVPLVREAASGCRLAPGSTMAIRRETWLTVGGEREDVERLEDWDFLFRLAEHEVEIAYVPEPLALIKQNLPGPDPAVVWRDARKVAAAHLHEVRKIDAIAARQLLVTCEFEKLVAAVRYRRAAVFIWTAAAAVARSPLGVVAHAISYISERRLRRGR